VVELGPGVGCFTRQILSRMHRNAKLLAIEVNPRFAAVLTRSIPDPRLRVVLGSALVIDRQLTGIGATQADGIVCSLPFANMPPEVRLAILRKSRDSLAQNGSLVLYQYRKLLLPMLRELFPSVETEYEWRNFPPARVFSCRTAPLREESGAAKQEYTLAADWRPHPCTPAAQMRKSRPV
jgi:phospholipid N-methyltransferase